MRAEETLTANNSFEKEVNQLVMLTQGFGIFVERELVTRRIKDKLLREMIVKTHADRMEQVKAQRAKLLLLIDPERRAREQAVVAAARTLAFRKFPENADYEGCQDAWRSFEAALADLDDADAARLADSAGGVGT